MTSFDVLIIKIGAGVLAERRAKKLARSLDAHFRIFSGSERVYNLIVMKFGVRVGAPDVLITHTDIGDDRFRGF